MEVFLKSLNTHTLTHTHKHTHSNSQSHIALLSSAHQAMISVPVLVVTSLSTLEMCSNHLPSECNERHFATRSRAPLE